MLARALLLAAGFIPETTLGCRLAGKGDITDMLNVTYRVVERGPTRFFVEALSDDHEGWRCVGEYRTATEADARKVKLEQILQRANDGIAGDGR